MQARERQDMKLRLTCAADILYPYSFNCGDRSSVGRALGCDPSRRGFESRRSPHVIFFHFSVVK